MRAKEFIYEVSPSLANALRTAATQAAAAKVASNPNATKSTTSAQPTQGSMSATQASAQQSQAGGTKTAPTSTTTAAPTLGKPGTTPPGANPDAGKPMGADTSKDDTLNKSIGTLGNQNPDLSKMNPAQLQTAFKPGKTFDVPGLGKLKSGRVTPQGIEFDASAVPSLGAKKITVDLKSLSQK